MLSQIEADIFVHLLQTVGYNEKNAKRKETVPHLFCETVLNLFVTPAAWGRLSLIQPLSLLRRQGRVAAPSVCFAVACILLAAAPTAPPCIRRRRRSTPSPRSHRSHSRTARRSWPARGQGAVRPASSGRTPSACGTPCSRTHRCRGCRRWRAARWPRSRPRSIKFLCIIAAPEGLKALSEAHPDVHIYCAAVDEKLNEHGYILPGLGDAGDRIFGTM